MLVVTGATGFLGAHLTMTLLLKGHTVKAIKRPSSNLSEFNSIALWRLKGHQHLLANFTWCDADVTDVLSLDEAFAGAEYVFHCAAIVAFKGHSSEMTKVNVEGTANVVNACIKANVKKLLYVSSTAALGRTDNQQEITEETQWVDDSNNTEYAISKHLAELEVWRGMEEGLNVFVVNPGIILGPGQWDKGASRLFSNIKKGFKFYTNGINGFVGVEDVAEVLATVGLSEIKNKRFLMVAENLSYKTLFDWMAKALKVNPPTIELKASYLPWLKWPIKLYSALVPKTNISYETLKTSVKQHRYNNSSIQAIGFKFTPIEVVVNQTSQLL